MSISLPLTAQVALVLSAAAAFLDVKTRRIPNVLTFGGAALACVLQAANDGPRGLGLAVAGWLVAVAIFFPFFALGGMGAGDVKLVGAIGACLGPAGALRVVLGAAISGGVVAVAMTLSRGYFRTSAANLGRLFGFWWTNGLKPMPELTLARGTGPRLAYAVPILIGTLGALWFG